MSNVTDMSDMFCDASSFNGDVSGWDVYVECDGYEWRVL